MKTLFRLAVLAGLALAARAAPARAHGAFGLFYDRCNKCCTGCDKPWNAFDGTAAANGYGPMPCQPYQGPGDPRAGQYLHPRRYFGSYGCGEEGIGCGMGCGPGTCWKESLKAKLHGFGAHFRHCKKAGDCDECGTDAGCGVNGCAPAPSPHGGHPVSYPAYQPVQYVPAYAPAMPQPPGYFPAWNYGHPAPASPLTPARY